MMVGKAFSADTIHSLIIITAYQIQVLEGSLSHKKNRHQAPNIHHKWPQGYLFLGLGLVINLFIVSLFKSLVSVPVSPVSHVSSVTPFSQLANKKKPFGPVTPVSPVSPVF